MLEDAIHGRLLDYWMAVCLYLPTRMRLAAAAATGGEGGRGLGGGELGFPLSRPVRSDARELPVRGGGCGGDYSGRCSSNR
jgi:hypothetical protein